MNLVCCIGHSKCIDIAGHCIADAALYLFERICTSIPSKSDDFACSILNRCIISNKSDRRRCSSCDGVCISNISAHPLQGQFSFVEKGLLIDCHGVYSQTIDKELHS